MHTPAFLKSHTAASIVSPDAVSNPPRRPLTRLQNPFRRTSSASPAPVQRTPIPASETKASGAVYLDTLGLRLGDAVSKALANPPGPSVTLLPSNGPDAAAVAGILRGKKPIPAGRGSALGEVMAQELKVASSDAYLYRAIVRLYQRPLSVLLTNLSTLLLPLLPYLDTSAPAQVHALALATFAAELLQCMDNLALGEASDGKSIGPRSGDGLRGLREGLESLVKRVVMLLIGGVKSDLGPFIDSLAKPVLHVGDCHALTSLSLAMPSAAQRLVRCSSPPGNIAQSALASLLIGLVWRAMAALSSRPLPDATVVVPFSHTPPGLKVRKDLPFNLTLVRSSAPSVPLSSTSVSTPNTTTPPQTPRFSARLPLPSLSRPPSPPSAAKLRPTQSVQQLFADAQLAFTLLSTLPTPADGSFAREAVVEAMEAMEAFVEFVRWAASLSSSTLTTPGVAAADTLASPATVREKTQDVPTMIALPVLLHLVHPTQRASGTSISSPPLSDLCDGPEMEKYRDVVAVHDLLGISHAEYKDGCLSGFGRAEACVGAVGRGVLEVMEQWGRSGDEGSGEVKQGAIGLEVVREWLEDRVAAVEA